MLFYWDIINFYFKKQQPLYFPTTFFKYIIRKNLKIVAFFLVGFTMTVRVQNEDKVRDTMHNFFCFLIKLAAALYRNC